MLANSAFNELSSNWQPFQECFGHLMAELRNMETLATSLSAELESMQHELLHRAHMVETLQAELSVQRQENMRLVSRCESQEQHMHEEFTALRSFMQSVLQRSETESEAKCLDVVKYAKQA